MTDSDLLNRGPINYTPRLWTLVHALESCTGGITHHYPGTAIHVAYMTPNVPESCCVWMLSDGTDGEILVQTTGEEIPLTVCPDEDPVLVAGMIAAAA